MGEPETRTLVPVAPQLGDDSTTTRATDPGRAQPSALPLPTIPRYTIVRQIGRGGMGIVYEAIGPLGVRVALKVILPERLSPSLLSRFRQEARTMMDLAHPNLARFFDYDESAAGPFFTMRLLPGDTLADRLAALRVEPTTSVRLMARVADAVAYLHARGLVHRDLKPSNILIDDRGEPHVSDFGLIKDLAAGESDGEGTRATPAGGASATLTHAGARLGTEAYMSPEQFAGDHARIGPPTDVWALGVILYELAWESRPRFDPDHQVQLPTDDGGSPVRTGLRPIVSRCLAWEPADRYPTAAALETELETLLAPPDERPSRRQFVVAGATGVLGLGAVGAWWAFGRRKDGSSGAAIPPDRLDDIRRELTETGKVDLLTVEGTWRWSEWMTGAGEWHPGPPPDGPADARGWLSVEPNAIRLLELARGLPGPGFRLAIEVRPVTTTGEVGVYVGRSVHTADAVPVHCLIALAIRNYQGPDRPTGQARRVYRLLGRSCPVESPTGFFDSPFYDKADGTGPPDGWLSVSIALTDARVNGHWPATPPPNGQTRNQLLRTGRELGRMRPGAAGLTPTFSPVEGVGLFAVNRTVLAVRTAFLERADS